MVLDPLNPEEDPMALEHTPELLLGRHVRINRRGFTFTGTVVSAGPYEGAEPGLSLLLALDDGGRTGFHLPTAATVEEVAV